jgi:alkylation response protein AidB-like acyl-CoA dehydrogenase
VHCDSSRDGTYNTDIASVPPDLVQRTIMGSIETSSEIHQSIDRLNKEELPKDEAGWIDRAREVAKVLALDAARRDIEQKSPFDEIKLLKASGLTVILGAASFGGGGQDWSVAYRAIREVSRGDPSIGMLLGYHLLWSTTADVVGTDDQRDRAQKNIVQNRWFLGGAVNPRNADLTIRDDGEGLLFNGSKHFNTGGVVSDVTVLEGVLDGTEDHIFALVPTKQDGIRFGHDWDNLGMRLTESGSVKIDHVRVPWTDALGWDSKTKRPIDAVLKVPFASLLLPTIQLVFSNFYLGIGLGALDEARKWTTRKTRAWPYGGDNKDKATDEFYVLERYGNFFAHLRAAESLADVAGRQISDLYADHSEKRDVSPKRRGEVAEWVASVKIVTTDTSLRVASGIFEVTGASSTGRKVGLDRFWRDIRTHTLHDPVSYKSRELGRYFLLGEAPEPTWYT